MAQYSLRTRIARDRVTGSRSFTGNLRVTTPEASQSRSPSRRRRHRTSDDRERRRHSSAIDYTHDDQARYHEGDEQRRRPRSSIRPYRDEYANGDPDYHESRHSRRNLPGDAYNTNEVNDQELSDGLDREYIHPDGDGPRQSRTLAIEDRDHRASRSVSPSFQTPNEATWSLEGSYESNPPRYNGHAMYSSTTTETTSRETVSAPARYSVRLHDPTTSMHQHDHSGSSRSLPAWAQSSPSGDDLVSDPVEPTLPLSAENHSSPSATVSPLSDGQNHLFLPRARAERGSQRKAYGEHIEDDASTILPHSTPALRTGRELRRLRPLLQHANTTRSVHSDDSSARMWDQNRNADTLSRSRSVGAASYTAREQDVIDVRKDQVDAVATPPQGDQKSESSDPVIPELRMPIETHIDSQSQDQPFARCQSCSRPDSPSNVGVRGASSHSRSDLSQSFTSVATSTDSRAETGSWNQGSRPLSGRSTPAAPLLNRPGSRTGAGTPSQHSYQYMPLKAEEKRKEFRLVKLLPKMMSKIQCHIIHQWLEDPVDYIAISYAWGDGIGNESLELEGVTIPVGISLFQALQALRQERHEILVWVDALCL